MPDLRAAMLRRVTWAATLLGVLAPPGRAADPSYVRTEDVIYGRKDGVALTLDVFRPREAGRANGAGVIAVISGGWYSSHSGIDPGAMARWTDRGYTVFAVVHGSQPRYTIPDAVADLHRAVRFVRAHAAEYGVDPDRLGITGGSAGGHLSLMIGTSGELADPGVADPVQRVSSRVQAVACFFPPTDFLNYGQPGEEAIGTGILKDYAAPFDFREYNQPARKFLPVTDHDKVRALAAKVSPITHVTPDDPPTLIIHGDADKLVPIQQAEAIVAKLKEAGVEAKLVAKPGLAHGWPDMGRDVDEFIAWFDAHLKPKGAAVPTPAP